MLLSAAAGMANYPADDLLKCQVQVLREKAALVKYTNDRLICAGFDF
jgi:hypothetical protein